MQCCGAQFDVSENADPENPSVAGFYLSEDFYVFYNLNVLFLRHKDQQ